MTMGCYKVQVLYHWFCK